MSTEEEPMQVTPATEPEATPPAVEAPAADAATPVEQPATEEPSPAPVEEDAAVPVVPPVSDVTSEPAPVAPEPVLTEKVQQVITEEKEAAANAIPRAKPDVQSLPTRQYLDQSVVPILLQALTALSKERPPDAIDFLIAYLMKNKSSFQQQSA